MADAPEFDPDQTTIDAVRQATHFIVSLYGGPGRGYWREHLRDLPLARRAGALMEEILKTSWMSMVYAVTADGRSLLIPRSLDACLLGQGPEPDRRIPPHRLPRSP